METTESTFVNLRLVRKRIGISLKRKNDNLLISGDGRCLKEDLYKVLPLNNYDIMSIGRSIKAFLPHAVSHWVNVDGPGSKWWAEHLPGSPYAIRHTIGECEGYDCIWDDGKPDGVPWYGSSALFAAMIGLILGYKAIVLAGCPMDKEGHWYFDKSEKGPDWREEDYQVWREFASLPKPGSVQSMSGWTKEALQCQC
jgi:hypothetical protein